MLRRIPLVFALQPDGGFTVTSPILPEFVTEGGTIEEAYANVSDQLAAVLELYADEGRPLPLGGDEESTQAAGKATPSSTHTP